MAKYSKERKYEKAAEARDAIAAVNEIMEEQKVVTLKNTEADIIDYVYSKGSYYFGVLNIRSGRLTGKKTVVFENVPVQENAMELFICQFYRNKNYAPKQIIIPFNSADPGIVSKIKTESKIIFKKRDKLLKMCRENIEEEIQLRIKNEELRIGKTKQNNEQMEKLKKAIGMKNQPRVIDAIDISHMSGENMVGSCVVFRDGKPDKNSYRRYKIKTVGGVDDYSSIKEVVARRYSRMIKEKQKLPDLILIDGGKGQVNTAKEELEKLDIYPEIAGLAKKEELVFKPYEKYPVKIEKQGLFLLMRARDEAHRFAVSYQTILADKKMKKTVFDGIPFVGDKTKQMIYSEFKDREEFIRELKKDSKRVKFLNNRQKKEILRKLSV